jgi:hypothetical protein
MDYDESHIDKVPFIVRGSLPVAPQYLQGPFGGEVFDMPLQALKMDGTVYRCDHEAIGPNVQAGQIKHSNIRAFMIGQKYPQIPRGSADFTQRRIFH